MKYEICAMTDVGRVRKNNEDGFCINSLGCHNTSECFVYEKAELPLNAFVADGVGGSKFGEEATRLCIRAAQEENIPYDINEIVGFIDRMNNSVVSRNKSIDCACTIAGVVLGTEGSYTYNLGDSRIYALEQGYLNQLSIDDTASGLSGSFPEECNKIKEPLVQYMGKENVIPHIKQVDSGTQFLICTDGLTDMLSLDEIETLFAQQESIKDIVRMLVDKAKEKGGFDNITVIIIRPVEEGCSNG